MLLDIIIKMLCTCACSIMFIIEFIQIFRVFHILKIEGMTTFCN